MLFKKKKKKKRHWAAVLARACLAQPSREQTGTGSRVREPARLARTGALGALQGRSLQARLACRPAADPVFRPSVRRPARLVSAAGNDQSQLRRQGGSVLVNITSHWELFRPPRGFFSFLARNKHKNPPISVLPVRLWFSSFCRRWWLESLTELAVEAAAFRGCWSAVTCGRVTPAHTQTHVHTHRHTHVMIWIHEQGSEKCFQELLGTALGDQKLFREAQCTSPQKSECALKRLHLRGDIWDSVPFTRAVQGGPNWMALVHKHSCAQHPGMCVHAPPPPPPPHTQTIPGSQAAGSGVDGAPQSEEHYRGGSCRGACFVRSLFTCSHGAYLGTLPLADSCERSVRCVTGKTRRGKLDSLLTLSCIQELTPMFCI